MENWILVDAHEHRLGFEHLPQYVEAESEKHGRRGHGGDKV